ncbi:Uncharacterized protein TCM_033987 [Theobroma cacao]|uniref:Uncharacterized protein n=1 Tax=Theobroma cacao TaxID=3641 RepID=A0A061FJP9_THECC|nr:Uncharacterized protein TCM_033987 [Theobroma cacao]
MRKEKKKGSFSIWIYGLKEFYSEKICAMSTRKHHQSPGKNPSHGVNHGLETMDTKKFFSFASCKLLTKNPKAKMLVLFVRDMLPGTLADVFLL